MTTFQYQEMFELGNDTTEYRQITGDFVETTEFEGKTYLKVDPEGLTILARDAIRDVSHLFRSSHLTQLAKIVADPEASPNDVFVADNLLENAVISGEMELPACQDTGTAIVVAKKGERVLTGGGDEAALSKGIYKTFTETNLRYSQVAPLTMYEEKNTGSNLPAQIEIQATADDTYRFLFITKGGGSANKTFLYQETKALLNPEKLKAFVLDKLKTLGTAACPPYHLALVIGGTSAEANLKTVKLASAHYLDELPGVGNSLGRAFRDRELEDIVLKIAQQSGIGAQFGGKYFAHDVRVVRLPRHGASCPVGLGVSCSADRNIKAKITKDGLFLEQLETNPAKYLKKMDSSAGGDAIAIDLTKGLGPVRKTLSKYPVKTRVVLSGEIIVARDIAHAKLKERLDRGEGLPDYFKNNVIYYAGPAKTPAGYASGSFGPTTAGRMDSYVPAFQKEGASLIMLAKGNRSKVVTESCKQYGGFYLGSIGGAAAILAKNNIIKQELIEYPELGMEAIYRITVKDFPAFILIDDKGNDFFAGLL